MEVMVHDPTGVKLSANSKGAFKITKVHSNGTVTICLKHNVFQRLNIRRIKPYFRYYSPFFNLPQKKHTHTHKQIFF